MADLSGKAVVDETTSHSRMATGNGLSQDSGGILPLLDTILSAHSSGNGKDSEA